MLARSTVLLTGSAVFLFFVSLPAYYASCRSYVLHFPVARLRAGITRDASLVAGGAFARLRLRGFVSRTLDAQRTAFLLVRDRDRVAALGQVQ